MSNMSENTGAVLVTGGSGYIGSHTVLELVKAGLSPVIFDNFSNSNRNVIERLNSLAGQTIPVVEGDCRNGADLERALDAHNITAVLHFAGLKSVGESVSDPLRYYDHNVGGFVKTLETARAAGVKQFVLSSSATVYAEYGDRAIPETAPLGPINPYGQTKLMCEEIGRDLCVADSDIAFAAMRYFNPIGAHPSGQIGEAPNDIPNNLMPYVARVAMGQLEQLSVYGNDYATPDGTGVRDYIHVVDLARGHVQALDFLTSNTGEHTFNLGTGTGTSVLELVERYQSINNIPVKYRIVDRRPGDQASVVANPDKARAALNFACAYGVQEACEHSFRWLSNNPNGY